MRNPQIIWATGHGSKKLGPQDTGSRARAESAEDCAGQGHQRQRETRFPRGLPTRHRAGASAMPIGAGGGTPTCVRGLQASRAEGEGRKQLSRPGPQTGPGAEPEPASSVCLVLSHSCTDGDPHP